MAKENPHYEDALDIIEEDGAEISRLRATIAEQAATIARLEGERDALEQVLAGERNMLASAWLDRGYKLPGAEKQSTIQRVLRGIHDLHEAEYAALERAMQAEAERDAALALAYIGEHRFPDLTWKARAEELVSDLRKAEAERDALAAAEQRERELLSFAPADVGHVDTATTGGVLSHCPACSEFAGHGHYCPLNQP